MLTNMPVECLAHLFCVCMAIATGKVGPVFTGPIFQGGVMFPMDQCLVSMALCVVGLVPSHMCRVFGCIAHYHDSFFS